MATFAHIGDFHAAAGPRNADRYRALDRLIAECEALPDLVAWLWPGDLSHQRQGIDDKNALATRLLAMAQRAPVLLVYGNHDLPGDLDLFARLQAPHPIVVVKQPQCVRLELPDWTYATVFCLPYPTRAGLVAAGIVPSDVIDVAAEALEHIFVLAADELAEAQSKGDLTLMVGHVNVAGSITSAGQPNIGHEIELSPRHLDRLGPIYKGLNHIHKAQEIAGAFYAGSVCRLSWGEIEAKSYITIRYAADGTHEVVRHPIDVAPMFHIEGELTREGFVIDADTFTADERRLFDWSDCEVRVRYRYKQSERQAIDDRIIYDQFRTALTLKVEPVAIPDRALRAPAVATATTLTDKVRAWADVSGVSTSAALLQKLARLESSDPAHLLTEVQQQLTTEQEETVAA